jgi:hypothetical protein
MIRMIADSKGLARRTRCCHSFASSRVYTYLARFLCCLFSFFCDTLQLFPIIIKIEFHISLSILRRDCGFTLNLAKSGQAASSGSCRGCLCLSL